MTSDYCPYKNFHGTPVKMTLVSSPCYFFLPPPECELELSQRLTVNSNGRVSFRSTVLTYDLNRTGDKKYGKWASLSMIPYDAEVLLEEVASFFYIMPIQAMATDVGTWELTLTNSDGETFTYNGSLIPDAFDGCSRISDYIRAKIDIDGLLCFDGTSTSD